MRTRTRIIWATLVAMLASGASVWALHGAGRTGQGVRPTPAGPLVRTHQGLLLGRRADAVDSFLGVRYGAAPTGELRWRAPRPASAWRGVRPATGYGSRCPALPGSNGAGSRTEDCLFLNVQRGSDVGAGERRAVYVFIHGGGFVNGGADQADTRRLVRETGVVGVSLNYRLGVLGWLGHPALSRRDGGPATSG